MKQLSLNPRNPSRQGIAGPRWVPSKLSVAEDQAKTTLELIPPQKVLVVDRDSMSSDLLAVALSREGTCEAAAIQAGELLRTLGKSEVDVVVIGAEIPSKGQNGFELARSVFETRKETSIVMLLNQTSRDSVIAAFRSGARGVFSREEPMTDFFDCVKQVGKGFIWAGKQETWFLLDAFRSIPAPSMVSAIDSPTLTTRELQAVRAAAKGKTNKAIAIELGLSEHTVKNYLFRAFEKLGVSSRVELLFYLTVRGHTFGPAEPDRPDVEFGVE